MNKMQGNKHEIAPLKTISIHYGLPSTNSTNPSFLTVEMAAEQLH